MRQDKEPRHDLRRIGLLTIALMTGWSVVAMYAVHNVIPYNPIKLPFEDKLRGSLLLLLPEGWAFFTRNPREPDTFIYQQQPGGAWHRAIETTRFHPKYGFGLDRSVRAVGVELGLLLEQAEKTERVECKGELDACLEHTPVAKVVNNPSPGPRLCGHIAAVFREPVPWAWSRSHEQRSIQMPTKVLHLEVHC